MDDLILRFDSVKDEDLCLTTRGCAYQRDMSKGRIAYGEDYFRTFTSHDYTKSERAQAVNMGRLRCIAGLHKGSTLIDIGSASGLFVESARDMGIDAMGYDIMPQAIDRLKSRGWFANDVSGFDAVTMWDSLEHMENPGAFLNKIDKGALLFVSIPIVDDVREVRKSKHYKPGEHLYYWTQQGFRDYMQMLGFRMLEISTHETDAGREQIGAFVLKKDIPGYREHIAAYMEMHAARYYGNSATGLYLTTISKVVRALRPKSILDFGCGRSDLVAHFWRDGERQIARYDPAIPALRDMPAGDFDMVLCCDVMEHIPIASVDKVLYQLRAKSATVIFTISTKPSRAKLPDGRNAHVTLLTKTEWLRWLSDYFGAVMLLPTDNSSELVVLTGEQHILQRAA